MREILFRGKHKATGKWCEGNLNIDKQGVAIITPDNTPLGCYGQVDPDTVGQYTGLMDIDGNKLFEGDVVEACFVGNNRRGRFMVYFLTGSYVFKSHHICHMLPSIYRIRLIGNVHDNPELIGGAE